MSDFSNLQAMLTHDNGEGATYRFDLRYQQEVLSMLLMDRVFLTQSIDLVSPGYFSEDCHKIICDILFSYFKEYKHMPPKFVIVNELRTRKKDDPRLYYYLGELESLIASYVSGLESREACLDKIADFAKEMALKKALGTTLDILRKGSDDKWGRIRTIFKDALTVDRNLDFGLDYFQTVEDRYTRMQKKEENREVFATGFRTIDEALNGGLTRGEMGAFVGLPGTGKSNLLVKAAVQNVLRDKKVLYVSLEMDEDKLAKRFDAQISQTPIGKLKDYRKEISLALKTEVAAYEDKRRLVIKQFAAGTANVDTLRAYMAQMSLIGFKPDLLVLDYVGEMKDIEGIKTYESRQRLVRDLRGFGTEEQHCTFTAMQPNRAARDQQEEGVIDDNTLGDSFGQARPLDALWSINQRPDEKKMNIGRIFIVKHRDGKSRIVFPFEQNPNTLDIQEISELRYAELKGSYTEKKMEENSDNIKTYPSRKK